MVLFSLSLSSVISCVDDLKYKTAFYILYTCGLRSGEIFALTWNDIDFDKKL